MLFESLLTSKAERLRETGRTIVTGLFQLLEFSGSIVKIILCRLGRNLGVVAVIV